MRLIPVALALFHRQNLDGTLDVWTQVREDDGPFHGLLEFPGGGVEAGETPLVAAVREVEEEVGIKIEASTGRLMGIYPRYLTEKTILLHVFLFPPHPGLDQKGRWLPVKAPELSRIYEGKIPHPNHQIIDDLYRALYSEPK